MRRPASYLRARYSSQIIASPLLPTTPARPIFLSNRPSPVLSERVGSRRSEPSARVMLPRTAATQGPAHGNPGRGQDSRDLPWSKVNGKIMANLKSQPGNDGQHMSDRKPKVRFQYEQGVRALGGFVESKNNLTADWLHDRLMEDPEVGEVQRTRPDKPRGNHAQNFHWKVYLKEDFTKTKPFWFEITWHGHFEGKQRSNRSSSIVFMHARPDGKCFGQAWKMLLRVAAHESAAPRWLAVAEELACIQTMYWTTSTRGQDEPEPELEADPLDENHDEIKPKDLENKIATQDYSPVLRAAPKGRGRRRGRGVGGARRRGGGGRANKKTIRTSKT